MPSLWHHLCRQPPSGHPAECLALGKGPTCLGGGRAGSRPLGHACFPLWPDSFSSRDPEALPYFPEPQEQRAFERALACTSIARSSTDPFTVTRKAVPAPPLGAQRHATGAAGLQALVCAHPTSSTDSCSRASWKRVNRQPRVSSAGGVFFFWYGSCASRGVKLRPSTCVHMHGLPMRVRVLARCAGRGGGACTPGQRGCHQEEAGQSVLP